MSAELSPAAASRTSSPEARPTSLVEYEQSDDKPPFILSRTEFKLLLIAGIGFFIDAYDLFIINPVSTMLQYRLYGGHSLPVGLEGFLKASANIGSVIGQFLFGYLADALGRKAIYGKELMIIILATILSITTPTGTLSPNSSLIYLAVFRILLGIGVGGDYPMSATVTSDRSRLRKRGTMLAYIFSMQAWGNFMGSLMTIIVLACYKHVADDEGKISKVDGVWRIVVGVSLIPACATLYHRLTMKESTRYTATKGIERGEITNEDAIAELKKAQQVGENSWGKKESQKSAVSTKTVEANEKTGSSESDLTDDSAPPEAVATKRAHFREFIRYFSKWKNAKLLIGTSVCWFLLDIAFYGVNLNQNVVLQQIGFAGHSGSAWTRIFKISVGGIIITALGFVPGYYASVLSIEYLGRKWIQIQGFLFAALFLGILAGKFHTLNTASFVVCFAFLQFFFNFGANTTTYCYPAEVFPTRYKATAHGISAASGKAGAIISALAFNTLSKKIGTPSVLWIFFGCCIGGAFFTLLLPEVKGRDPDMLLIQEIQAQREESRRSMSGEEPRSQS